VPSLRVTLGARFEKFLRFEVTQDFQPSSLPAHAALSAADAMDWRYVFVRGEFMKIRVVSALLMILAFVCCSSTPRTVATTPASRVYQGTASVGDFMTITVNSGEGTIAYTDVSNNTSGTVPYTTNSDGTYRLNDPTGNLVAAYEVPNYALLIQATKTGPNANSPALVTAVESGQISLSTFEGQAYNYMQFRTASGGLEIGSVTIGAQGTGEISSFWPYGSYNQGNKSGSPFGSGTLDLSEAQVSSSGTFLTVPDPGGSGAENYIFGTANGVFAVDTQNGAILGLRKAASSAFDQTVAGTYKAIYYQKTNATTGAGNVEMGTPILGNATIIVASNGQVTVNDGNGNQMVKGVLSPVASTSYLYQSDMSELQDPCDGLFTLRITTPGVSQQDVFATFMGQAMLFSSFTANLAQQGTYSYFYGVGLK
jgi:hypothetical protein